MLRLRTNVTTSPFASRRSSSATSATRASSGPRAEEGDDLVDADLFAREHAVEHLADRSAGARRTRERQQRRGGGSSPPDAHVSSRAKPSPSERCITVNRRSGSTQVSSRDVLGIDREPRGEHLARGLGRGAQPFERGPRPLGVHVIEGDGRDTAPVVDARGEERREVVAEVRWRLEMDRRRQHDAAPAIVHTNSSVGHGSALCIAVPGFGRKFWTITSCT